MSKSKLQDADKILVASEVAAIKVAEASKLAAEKIVSTAEAIESGLDRSIGKISLAILCLNFVLIIMVLVRLNFVANRGNIERGIIHDDIASFMSSKMDDRYRGADAHKDFQVVNNRLDEMVGEIKMIHANQDRLQKDVKNKQDDSQPVRDEVK